MTAADEKRLRINAESARQRNFNVEVQLDTLVPLILEAEVRGLRLSELIAQLLDAAVSHDLIETLLKLRPVKNGRPS